MAMRCRLFPHHEGEQPCRRKVATAIRAEQHARGVEIPFEVVSNPEFLKEGSAVADFQKPDRIVGMDLRSAELTKNAANAMLANLAERLGCRHRTRAHWLPVHLARLRSAQQAGYVPELLQAVEAVNQFQKQRLHRLISQHFGGLCRFGRPSLCGVGPGL